jgi:hypothetical protein
MEETDLKFLLEVFVAGFELYLELLLVGLDQRLVEHQRELAQLYEADDHLLQPSRNVDDGEMKPKPTPKIKIEQGGNVH